MKIAFIGMMATGKTTIGKKLAEKLNYSFIDTDEVIISRIGMSIDQTFITFGEKTFRGYENSILFEIVWQDNIVLSTGGGIVLNSQNMDLMEDFIKIRLTANENVIHDRVKDDFSRPLIFDNSPCAIKKIIDEREQYYLKYADYTFDTSNMGVDEIVNQIYDKLVKS